jgi:hypothetical protein
MKIYKFYNMTFEASLNVVVNCSWKEFVKATEKVMGEPWDDAGDEMEAEGFYTMLVSKDRKKKRQFVWIEEFNWTVYDIAKMVHELCHWMMSTFNDKGIPVAYENQETMAYTMQWAVVQVFTKLKLKKSLTTKKHEHQTHGKVPGRKGRGHKHN